MRHSDLRPPVTFPYALISFHFAGEVLSVLRCQRLPAGSLDLLQQLFCRCHRGLCLSVGLHYLCLQCIALLSRILERSMLCL